MSAACAANDRQPVSVMWKTVSEDCNLACDYCYYSTCGGSPGAVVNRIESGLLDKFIREYMEHSQGAVSFAWQGGEPLLAGMDFFEEVIRLQTKYARPGMIVSNALQTNGTLLTDRWGAFLKKYHFLVGVSLDGPREVHDARRVDSLGQGSFDRVMKGIGVLRRHGVDFNILTVVHGSNVGRAEELLAFYEQERFDYVQLIPCMDFRSQQVDAPGIYEVTPKQYGEFLRRMFDWWYRDGSPARSIRMFDNMLQVYVNRPAELCIHREACPKSMVLESGGDAYPCDFYIHPDWKLGSVKTHTFEELLDSPVYDRFLGMKPMLPEACTSCEWLKLCHGGCPRSRVRDESRDAGGTDYFCHSYRMLFAYAHERMQLLAAGVRRRLFEYGVKTYYRGRPPGRNDLCPCGSGNKYKHCCLK